MIIKIITKFEFYYDFDFVFYTFVLLNKRLYT